MAKLIKLWLKVIANMLNTEARVRFVRERNSTDCFIIVVNLGSASQTTMLTHFKKRSIPCWERTSPCRDKRNTRMYVVRELLKRYRKYTLAAMLSAGIALSVERLPVKAIFFAPVQTGLGAYPASDIAGTGSFPRLKQPGRGADTHSYLAPR